MLCCVLTGPCLCGHHTAIILDFHAWSEIWLTDGPQIPPPPHPKTVQASGGGPAPMTTEEGLAKLNARQKMAYWEVQKEMEREMDLAEIEEYKETQRLLDEGVVGYLPEKISNRMLKRLVGALCGVCVGGWVG